MKAFTKSGSMDFQYGKMPPQAIDLENAVLGAVLLDTNAVDRISNILLTPEAFYNPKNQLIYNAIIKLNNSGKKIDILTVTEQLKTNGELEQAGGAYAITELTDRVASSAHIEEHARIILDRYQRRALITSCQNTITDLYSDEKDTSEILSEYDRTGLAISESGETAGASKLSDVVTKTIKELDKAAQSRTSTGITTGFTKLDKVTGGWQRSDLIIIAARPGMGKTAFTLSAARAAANKSPIAIFSLEMSKNQLAKRLLSAEAEIPGDRFRTPYLLNSNNWQDIHTKSANFEELPIYIDDTPGLNIQQLRSRCKIYKKKYGIELIMVDYLQLLTSSKGNRNRENEISEISRSLKLIAKELDVPVIALSQLSRAVETRGGDKKPQLSDLRESGAIEQDADMVMFLYRPEYYGYSTDSEGRDITGVCRLIIAKHRNGALENVNLSFTSEYAKFADLNDMGAEREIKTPYPVKEDNYEEDPPF